MQFATLRSKSLGDQAYQALVEALMKGALRAGDRIRIHALAQKLGTSVTPVRDAVLRLVQDEALVMRNARDIRVPIISPEQYIEIRSVRLELEGLAAEQAALAASAHDIERLKALLLQSEDADKRGDHANDAALNQLFHAELAVIGGAPILLGVLRRLWTRTGPFLSEAYERSERVIKDQHRAIVDAVKAHNPQLARAAVRKDILDGSNELLQAYQSGATPARGRRRPPAPAGRKTRPNRKK